MKAAPVDRHPSQAPVAVEATSLAAAVAGRPVCVVDVVGNDGLAQRLAATGVWPGARMELVGKALFGDPMLFRLHGYRLALRRSEAERVRVMAVEGG